MASTSIPAAMPTSFVILRVWNVVQDFPTVREMFLFQSPVNLLDPTEMLLPPRMSLNSNIQMWAFSQWTGCCSLQPCLLILGGPQRPTKEISRCLAMSNLSLRARGGEETVFYFAEICPGFVLRDKWQILWSIKVLLHPRFRPWDLCSAMKQFSFQWQIEESRSKLLPNNSQHLPRFQSDHCALFTNTIKPRPFPAAVQI